MDLTPPRFEDDFPNAATFMMRIFAAGGKLRRFRIPGGHVMQAQFPSRLPRNEPCVCGSGIKAKKCHEQWT